MSTEKMCCLQLATGNKDTNQRFPPMPHMLSQLSQTLKCVFKYLDVQNILKIHKPIPRTPQNRFIWSRLVSHLLHRDITRGDLIIWIGWKNLHRNLTGNHDFSIHPNIKTSKHHPDLSWFMELRNDSPNPSLKWVLVPSDKYRPS